MPLGQPYASLDELKDRLDVDDTVDDEKLTRALSAASESVRGFCRRDFGQETTPSARVYRPLGPCVAHVDDFHTTDGLVIATDDDGDGTFETTWDASDYQLEPLNGVVDGEPGWPFWRIRAVGDRTFPRYRRASLQVTAQWGWAEVPDAVREATLIIAEELYKLKDAPFGVAGFGDFGVVRVRDNPVAMGKLTRFRRSRRSSDGYVLVGA